MQPLVPLVFHNLPSLYPPSFRRNGSSGGPAPPHHLYRYLRGRIKAGTHGLSAVERGRLWSMADRTWQIEHRGEFRLALRRATSLPRGNQRDYVSYKTLVYTMAFCLCFTWQRSWLLVHRPTRAPPSWSMYRRHSRMPRKPRAAVVQL